MGNYVLLHTEFFDHPMIVGLGVAPRVLYVAGLCLSARYWSGGYIPEEAIPHLYRQVGTTEEEGALAALVETGLWLVEEGGYLVARGGRLPRWKLQGRGHRAQRQRRSSRSPTGGLRAQEERKSPEYRQWRARVLARDNYQCAQCPATDGLHVHHIKDFAPYPALRLEPDNGITLCLACHERTHGRRLAR